MEKVSDLRVLKKKLHINPFCYTESRKQSLHLMWLCHIHSAISGLMFVIFSLNRHWLYGDKMVPSLPGKEENKSKGCDRVRGWFPRRCAVDVAEANHRQRMAAAAERKKVK